MHLRQYSKTTVTKTADPLPSTIAIMVTDDTSSVDKVQDGMDHEESLSEANLALSLSRLDQPQTQNEQDNTTSPESSRPTEASTSEKSDESSETSAGESVESLDPTKKKGASHFLNRGKGNQYNTTGGIQHNATGTGTQFSGVTFKGAVTFQ